jgi:hypothetical protein
LKRVLFGTTLVIVAIVGLITAHPEMAYARSHHHFGFGIVGSTVGGVAGGLIGAHYGGPWGGTIGLVKLEVTLEIRQKNI